MNCMRRLWPAAALCLIVSAHAQQISTAPLEGTAGPQQANDLGRTALPMQVQKSIAFREIGPAISGGRVTAVAGIPGNPRIYYVGSADGGVFRTNNGGTTWTALFQHQHVASIGALAVDPVNPDVLWAGTGEANVRNDVSFGDGVYKSTDAGAHWQHVGLDKTFQISRIAIDPHDPNTVLVAAMGSPYADTQDRGVYRTTDGGAHWQRVLFIAPGVGISDLAMNPANPQVLFAAAYEYRRTPWSYSDGGPADAIYRSLDGGNTWQRLSGHGLPSQPVARIGLAVGQSSPNVVYAVMGSNQGVLWRSDDNGDHWEMVSKNEEVDSRPFYFSHVAVDPKDANHVFAISNLLMESSDGGHTFHSIAKQIHVDHHTIWIDPAGSGRIIEGNDGGVALSRDNGSHWDFVHNIAIGQFYHAATNDQNEFLVCGGLQDNSAWCGLGESKNPAGILDRSWFTLNGGDGIFAIPAADDPNLIYDSTQNGVFMVFDRKAEQVHDIEPYPRDFNGGGVADLPYRFAWGAGFAVSPQNPKVLYAGGNVLFKSEDRGRTWKPISPDLTRNEKAKQASSGGAIIKDNSGAEVFDAILSIAPSTKDPKVLWVGTDDGVVQVTRDGGASWKNVTASIATLEPWGRVESIDLSANDPGDALIAVNRHFSGDFKPYLFHTTDYGATWTSVSGNLPNDVYAHVVRRDLKNPRLYYAGLENGLYVSWDAGDHWYLFGLGLPNTSVYDVALDATRNDLIAATHGRALWVLDDLAPFQNYSPQVAHSTVHLFPPAQAVRFWPWSQIEFAGDGAFFGKNPPYGADMTYWVGDGAKGPARLTITDAKGHVVRTYQGTHELEPGEHAPNEEGVPAAAMANQQTEQGEAKPAETATSSQAKQQLTEKGTAEEEEQPKEVPWVPVQPGLQRIYWDLRANGPVRWNAGLPFEKGPVSGAMLPPGEYTATLTLGGETSSQKFTVVNDPLSNGERAGMEARYQDTEAVLHQISQLDTALNRIAAIHAQADALATAAKGMPEQPVIAAAIKTLEEQSKAMEAKITSNPGAEESTLRKPDQIREKLFALDGLLEGSDEAPTAAALDQVKLLDPQYHAAVEAYNHYLQDDVAAFNHTLAEHHLTGVIAGDPLQP